MEIRKATLKDVPNMVDMWLELMNHHVKLDPFYYGMNKQAVQSGRKWIRKTISGKNSIGFIAKDNNQIIGYICGSIQKRSTCYKIEKNGFIEGAVVTKKYQGKGVGRKLEKELIGWFKIKKVKFIELRTYAKNKKTVTAWKKMGFKENHKIMLKKL